MLNTDQIYEDLRSDLEKMEEDRLKRIRRIQPFKIFFQICMLITLAEGVHMLFFDGFSNDSRTIASAYGAIRDRSAHRSAPTRLGVRDERRSWRR